MLKIDPDYEYDAIAEQIFFPIFPYIAREIVTETGIRSGRVLDAGCGGGHLGFALLDLLPEMQGSFLDIDPAAVRHARARAQERALASRASFHVGNVEALPFGDESFDLVISRGSIPFWDDQRRAFSEFYRVLKKGGRTFIGGSLGSAEMREKILREMHANGLTCFGETKDDISKALKPEEYAAFFKQNGWNYRVFLEPDDGGRWYILEKAEG